VDNTRKTFEAQLKPMLETISYTGNDVENYDELTVRTFKTVESAKTALSEQIHFMEQGLKKIEEDPGILNIPVGKKLILSVLKRGLRDTKKELLGDVDKIFERYSK
jgi:hypothetical protein